MKDLGLNEMLRYVLAGSVAVAFLCASYEQPFLWLIKKHDGDLIAAASAAVPFLVGVIAYILHRAALYPALYRLLCSVCGRKEPLSAIDITRWRNLGRKGALQPRLSEWAAQVHFLYSSIWAIIIVDIVARMANFTPSPWRYVAYGVVALLMLLAVIHHARYLCLEKEVFVHDNTLPRDG